MKSKLFLLLVPLITSFNFCEKCICSHSSQTVDCSSRQLNDKSIYRADGTFPELPTYTTKFYIRHNFLTNAEFIADAENLEVLDLTWNNITKLPYDIFDDLDQLRVLKLGHNLLETLDDDIFEWNPLNLQLVDFSHNKLRFIQHFLFYDTNKLNEIHLQHNEIRWIHPHTFDNLEELRILDLSYARNF